MKLYTYINNKLVKTNEMTILVKNKNELKELNEFINSCILQIESNELEHEHFSDFLHTKKYKSNNSELIIARTKIKVK